MVSPYIPDRGDIVWIDFSPQVGHEQAGYRPALVVSPISYNLPSGLMLACPITSTIKDYPFEVRLRLKDTEGVILADQVKNLDWRSRPVRFDQIASHEVIDLVQRLIASLVMG